MQLNGGQLGELREVLLNAFDIDSFQIMILERLDKDLSHYTSINKDFPTILFEVIKKANREEWIDELILKAKEFVPKNAKLYSFAQRMGLTSSTAQQSQELERLIVASNQFLDISLWNTKLSQIESQVCRIEIEYDQGQIHYGTGFLISSNILITNYHVMEAVILAEEDKTTEEGHSAKAVNVQCRFDYKYLAGKTLNQGTIYKLHHNWKIDLSPNSPFGQLPPEDHLDYAIIRLEGSPGDDLVGSKAAYTGEKRGWIKVPTSPSNSLFTNNSALLIVQHPNAAPLKLALNSNAIIGLNANKTRLQYRTNTDPGSSGSPCFNQKLELIALHHSGDPSDRPSYNEGIPFSAITALLKKRNISLDSFELNKFQNTISSSQQPNNIPIISTTNQSTKSTSTTNQTLNPNPISTKPIKPSVPSDRKEILSIKQGAVKTAVVAFVVIEGLKEVGGIESVELLAKLHSSIKFLISAQPQLKIKVLSNLLGAIILFPISNELDPLDTIKLVINLNNQMVNYGIAIRLGMTLGELQELVDIDGKANFIGVCINQAARLATARKENFSSFIDHPGLLIHQNLVNHLQSTLKATHWLSSRNPNRLSNEVQGKREENFLCCYPPSNIWSTLSKVNYKYDDSFRVQNKNAALISYDLPNFSDGDRNQLSQRFRAISDVFSALARQTYLPLEYFYFSPGGDGGVVVLTDLDKKTVYDLAKNFAEGLLIESQNKSSLISSECRIGLHYGTVLFYENAQGDLCPTGDDIFIADSIASDDAVKQTRKLIFTETFIEAASGGDNNYFNQHFQQLPNFHFITQTIRRYVYKQLPCLPSIKLEVHKAYFKASPILYYFLSVTNLSNHPVTVTHLWYEDANNYIPVNPQSRPLPKTLEPTEVWASWLPLRSIPSAFTNDAYNLFHLRLSNGQTFPSCQNTRIPPVGSVPGGMILNSDIKKYTNVNNMDKSQELAINYIKTLEQDLEAAYRDLSSSLSEIDRERIKRKIIDLQNEIKHLKDKLN